MMQSLGTNFTKYRRFLPLSATILLFFIAYAVGALFYSGMRDSQVFFTLFITSPFLLINAIGAATPKPSVFTKNQSPIYKP